MPEPTMDQRVAAADILVRINPHGLVAVVKDREGSSFGPQLEGEAWTDADGILFVTLTRR